eukprot:Gb_07060 [translate_table: standard]
MSSPSVRWSSTIGQKAMPFKQSMAEGTNEIQLSTKIRLVSNKGVQGVYWYLGHIGYEYGTKEGVSLLEECAASERALEELKKKATKIVDKLGLKEQLASLLLILVGFMLVLGDGKVIANSIEVGCTCCLHDMRLGKILLALSPHLHVAFSSSITLPNLFLKAFFLCFSLASIPSSLVAILARVEAREANHCKLSLAFLLLRSTLGWSEGDTSDVPPGCDYIVVEVTWR